MVNAYEELLAGGGGPMAAQAAMQQLPSGLNWSTLGADSLFNDQRANVYHPKGLIAPQIEAELRRMGYTGSLVNATTQPYSGPASEYQREKSPWLYVDENVQTASPELLSWLANNGLSIQSAATSPDREGGTFYSQLVGRDGTSLVQDAWDDKKPWTDRYLPGIALAGIAGLTGAGLMGLGQAGAGAAAGAAEAGAAGAGGIGTLGAGGTSMVPIGASMSPGALGITALGPAVGTGAELAALSAALPTLGSSAASTAAPGLLDTLKNAGNSVKDFVSPVSNLVGGAGNLAAIVGGALGAANSGGTNTSTTQSQIDPRMQQYLYGTGYGDTNSLLGAAQAQFKANPTGINPTMQQGLDMSKAALSDPAYSQAFQQMRSVGTGLLGNQAAGNPFTTGQGPTMQAGGMGGLLGNTNLQGLMARGRGLLN